MSGFFSSTCQNVFYLSTLTDKIISIRGDSNTNSIGADNPDSGFAYVLVDLIVGVSDIVGVNGSHLQNANSCGRIWFNPTTGIPTKTTDHGLLILAFGTNDIILFNGNFTSEAYKTQYRLDILEAFSKGWQSNEILLIAPQYMNEEGYSSLVGYCSVAESNYTRFQEYSDAVKAIAKEYHTYFFDPRITLVNTGNADDYMLDGLHLNQDGHTLVGTSMSTKKYSLL